jgi:hypothetical protein
VQKLRTISANHFAAVSASRYFCKPFKYLVEGPADDDAQWWGVGAVACFTLSAAFLKELALTRGSWGLFLRWRAVMIKEIACKRPKHIYQPQEVASS